MERERERKGENERENAKSLQQGKQTLFCSDEPLCQINISQLGEVEQEQWVTVTAKPWHKGPAQTKNYGFALQGKTMI